MEISTVRLSSYLRWYSRPHWKTKIRKSEKLRMINDRRFLMETSTVWLSSSLYDNTAVLIGRPARLPRQIQSGHFSRLPGFAHPSQAVSAARRQNAVGGGRGTVVGEVVFVEFFAFSPLAGAAQQVIGHHAAARRFIPFGAVVDCGGHCGATGQTNAPTLCCVFLLFLSLPAQRPTFVLQRPVTIFSAVRDCEEKPHTRERARNGTRTPTAYGWLGVGVAE